MVGMGLRFQSHLSSLVWKNVLCCSCWSDNGYQQFTLVVYLTQHRVTETTENSQTINKNAHCRLEFAKRNREFPHKQQFIHCYLGSSCIFSYSCYHFPCRIQIMYKLNNLKWHFLNIISKDHTHTIWGKTKLSRKSKIQLKNFVLKGNFKLFFLQFPEYGMHDIKNYFDRQFSHNYIFKKHSIQK